METTQRWRERQSRWMPKAAVFNPRQYTADYLEEGPAKRFVTTHHYSGTYPAAVMRIGLFHGTELTGVAVFSVPPSQQVIPHWLGGIPPHEGVDLGRFVLLDSVGYNGETWFLARCFKLLRAAKPSLRGVTAFADPVPRRNAAGTFVMPGHIGIIYQAFNGAYLGRATPRILHVARTGEIVSEKVKCKLRVPQQGTEYAERLFQRLGAPARYPGESGKDYLARGLKEGGFDVVRHPGNHVYAWPLDDTLVLAPGQRYPKKEASCPKPT